MERKILDMLDEQYARIWTCINGIQRDIQMGYYDGMRDMYELIIGMKIGINSEGKHYILQELALEAT